MATVDLGSRRVALAFDFKGLLALEAVCAAPLGTILQRLKALSATTLEGVLFVAAQQQDPLVRRATITEQLDVLGRTHPGALSAVFTTTITALDRHPYFWTETPAAVADPSLVVLGAPEPEATPA